MTVLNKDYCMLCGRQVTDPFKVYPRLTSKVRKFCSYQHAERYYKNAGLPPFQYDEMDPDQR